MADTDHEHKPLTVEEIREYICRFTDGVDETIAALGTDLKRDDDGWITDDSDLGIAVRELEHVTSFLSHLSFNLYVRGVEAAPPGDM